MTRSRTSIRSECPLWVVACLLLAAMPVFAQDTASTTTSRIEQSRSQADEIRAHDEQLALEWGLKTEEWRRYSELMRGPLGIYSPNLDPLTALGIEARSDAERRHFAQLQVQAEGRRAEKTLAYQRAYDEAWRQQYPGLLPLSAAHAEATPARASGTDLSARLAVFIKDHCSGCDERVQQLQAGSRAFDIYMVGSEHNDERIRQWAARVGIDVSKVKSQVITLNHDAGRWLSIGGNGALPAVVTEVNGQWQRE